MSSRSNRLANAGSGRLLRWSACARSIAEIKDESSGSASRASSSGGAPWMSAFQ
jgi:hypothetical protein